MKNKILISTIFLFLHVGLLLPADDSQVVGKQSGVVASSEPKDLKSNELASVVVSQSTVKKDKKESATATALESTALVEAKASEKPEEAQDKVIISTVNFMDIIKNKGFQAFSNEEESFSDFAKKAMKFFLKKGYWVSQKISDRFNSDSLWLEDKIYDCCMQDDSAVTFTSQDYNQLSETYHLFIAQTAKKIKDFKIAVVKTIAELNFDQDIKKEIEANQKDIETNKKEIEVLNKKISNLQMGIVVGLVGFIAYEAFRYYQNSDNSDK